MAKITLSFLFVEVYDPNSNEWTAPSVVYEGEIYVIGGSLKDKITSDKMLIYDPETNEWTEGTPLTIP